MKIRLFDWFKTKTATALFAIAALIGGFLFLDPQVTGQAILNERYKFNPVSMVGSLLILCSIILGVYSVKSKK